MPRWYPPIGRPIGTPPRDTHITWPWRLRPAVSYQSSGAASAPGGNTPRALYGAGADGHPEAPDRRPLGACPYRRQCAECSPSKFIDGLFQTVMGKRCEECLLYALPRRTPSRFWLERRDVLRWMRRVGMLRRGGRESDWKGAKRPGTPNLRGGMRRGTWRATNRITVFRKSVAQQFCNTRTQLSLAGSKCF